MGNGCCSKSNIKRSLSVNYLKVKESNKMCPVHNIIFDKLCDECIQFLCPSCEQVAHENHQIVQIDKANEEQSETINFLFTFPPYDGNKNMPKERKINIRRKIETIKYVENGAHYEYHGEVDENDIRDGHGVLIRSFTSRFEGFWVNGQIHGFGRLINHASIIVEGNWINGNEPIYGVRARKFFMDKYIGELANEKADGKGILFCCTKLGIKNYDGNFKEDKFHGLGHLTENRYEGDWFEYKGNFSKGLFSGKGELKTLTDEYSGEFVNGQKQGKGTMKNENGYRYTGEYFEGQMHGWGTLTHSNEIYTGEFRHGAKHGKGEYNYSPTKTIKGKWQDGRLLGEDGKPRKIFFSNIQTPNRDQSPERTLGTGRDLWKDEEDPNEKEEVPIEPVYNLTQEEEIVQDSLELVDHDPSFTK